MKIVVLKFLLLQRVLLRRSFLLPRKHPPRVLPRLSGAPRVGIVRREGVLPFRERERESQSNSKNYPTPKSLSLSWIQKNRSRRRRRRRSPRKEKEPTERFFLLGCLLYTSPSPRD